VWVSRCSFVLVYYVVGLSFSLLLWFSSMSTCSLLELHFIDINTCTAVSVGDLGGHSYLSIYLSTYMQSGIVLPTVLYLSTRCRDYLDIQHTHTHTHTHVSIHGNALNSHQPCFAIKRGGNIFFLSLCFQIPVEFRVTSSG